MINDELKALFGLLRSSVKVQFTIPYECFDENIDNSNCDPCQRVMRSLDYLKTDDTLKILISSIESSHDDVIIIVEKKQTFGDGNE